MLLSVINATDNRDVASIGIPNAFVQTTIQGIVHVRIRGKLAQMLLEIQPNKYREYATTNKKGEVVIYMHLLKSLYGIMQAALLFYQKLVRDLVGYGFKINPYDNCVGNKQVNGRQMTIIWHVDDIQVPHADPHVVTKMITWLRRKYESEELSSKMKVCRGKVHDHLGVTYDYTIKGKFKVTMSKYIKSIIDEFPYPVLNHSENTPGADVLFNTREHTEKMEPSRAQLYHRFVVKLLYLTKRSHPDVSTTIAFLTTRVQSPDLDDWNKLIRCLRYLRNTQHLPLELEATGTEVCKWWVDASYAVHPDRQSHTGSLFSLGKGAITSHSTKKIPKVLQKQNW